MSWHSNELWYMFASLREGVPPARPWQPMDYELADQMSGYWANFIKTGDVNAEGLPHWPESTLEAVPPLPYCGGGGAVSKNARLKE